MGGDSVEDHPARGSIGQWPWVGGEKREEAAQLPSSLCPSGPPNTAVHGCARLPQTTGRRRQACIVGGTQACSPNPAVDGVAWGESEKGTSECFTRGITNRGSGGTSLGENRN